jgi:DNA-binding NarL/FixJ family response regulator
VITLLLADDHGVVREGMRALLSGERDFEVVGEVSDGLKVIPAVEKLKPRVLVLDLMMSGLNGLEITRQITQARLDTRVLVLSMHANEGYVLEALRHGALGYVVKECSGGEVIAAVRAVAAGRHWLSPPFAGRAEELLARSAQAPADPYDTLTAREREVFQLSAEGYTSAQIGLKLHISSRTVESHRANLMRKLGLHGQSDLVRLAVKRGLLPESA